MRGGMQSWSDNLTWVTLCLTVVAGVSLLTIVATVTAGVVMRYAFGTPLLGINEIVQLTAVALVMASLPYCTVREEHVAVDLFENRIGKWGRFIGDILSRALSGLVLAILCYRAILKMADSWQWGDATNMLRLPLWPFYTVLAAGAGLCALIFAAQLVLILIRGAK